MYFLITQVGGAQLGRTGHVLPGGPFVCLGDSIKGLFDRNGISVKKTERLKVRFENEFDSGCMSCDGGRYARAWWPGSACQVQSNGC